MKTLPSIFTLGSSQIAILVLAWTTTTAPYVRSQGDNEFLPLPQWAPNEELAPLLGGLLPQDPQMLQAGPSEAADLKNIGPRLQSGPPQVYPDPPSGLQIGDMGLFLPESLLAANGSASAPLRPPTPTIALEPLPSEVLDAANHSPQDQFLIDPLSLIPEMPRSSLERFLEFHDRDARITTFVILMDRHHKLPENVDWNRLSAGRFSSGDACLVAYPLGEPWRARVFLSRKVHEAASHRYLTEMAADCVNDALQVSEPHDQLHRFVVRLSTRLFWLEKIMPPTTASSPGTSELQEVADSSPDLSSTWVKAATLWLSTHLVHVGAGTALALLGLGITWGIRRRRAASLDPTTVYLLPEPTIEPRLGGAFSGGAGASSSFK